VNNVCEIHKTSLLCKLDAMNKLMQRGRCRKSFGAGICICAGYRLLRMVNIITASFKNNVTILNYSLWKLTNHIILLLN